MGQEEVRGVLLGVRSSRGFVCLLGYSYIYLCECYLNVSSLNRRDVMNMLELAALLLGVLGAALTGRDASKGVRVQELEDFSLESS